MSDPFVDDFSDLFVGRRDVYAEGKPDPHNPAKYRYMTVREPLTRDVLKDHLKGGRIVGIYPILSDSTVGWFAVDFDAPKDENGETVADPFPIAWEAAVKQAEAFEAAGLHVYLERSRSGKGVHVWGFFDRPIPARTVRRALRSLLTDHEIFTSRDRMYPVQDELSDTTTLGNLIALPFFAEAAQLGNSMFLDRQTLEPIDRRVFVASVRKNAAEVLEALAEQAPKVETTTVGAVRQFDGEFEGRPARPIRGALKVISRYGCPFMRYAWVNRKTLAEPMWHAVIGQCTAFENGLDFAHLMSRDYPEYRESEVNEYYRRALEHPPVGYAWLQANFPEVVGDRHNGKAPYWVAKQSILGLSRTAAQDMTHVGSFDGDLERIRRLDSGAVESGIRWGLSQLDEIVRLRPGELTVLGAMQSIGKTAMMIDGIVRMARNGVHCFVFSAETGPESLRNRLLSRVSGVNSRALRGEHQDPDGRLSKSEWQRLKEAAAELSKLPIYEDYTSLSPDDVLNQVEHVLLSNHVPLDSPYVVFFDYLQYGSKMPGEDSEFDRLSRLVSEFKFSAKILEHPVVVLSQLKREKEAANRRQDNEDKDSAPQPDLTWFKGTGRIESDMDVGMILTGERSPGRVVPRVLTIVKQREGEANIPLTFNFDQTVSEFLDNGPAEGLIRPRNKEVSVFSDSVGDEED